MLSTAVCGWLMERESAASDENAFGRAKKVTTRFYIEQVVPEAMGLRAAATATAEVLYALDTRELAERAMNGRPTPTAFRGERLIERVAGAHSAPLLLKQLLTSGITRRPDQEIVYRGNVRPSYRVFGQRVSRLAKALLDVGMTAGKTIAILD